MNYTNQRKVKKADDKHMLWGVVVVLLAFWGTKLFAKKGPTGTVEVGEGDFGDFDTDGEFDDGENDGSGSGSGGTSTKTPDYVPGKTTVPDSGSTYSESVKETMPYEAGYSGCGPLCIK